MKSASELCVSCVWIMALGEDGWSSAHGGKDEEMHPAACTRLGVYHWAVHGLWLLGRMLKLCSWWQGWTVTKVKMIYRGVFTELLVHGVTHRSWDSHEQVSGLVCVIQNWCLIQHLICKVCETPDSCKGEILEDTLSLAAIQLMNWGYFVHAPCVGICAWNLAVNCRWM